MSILFKHKVNWKYAIGEVLLIFIGITLAIAFNNWNEARKLKKQTNGYIQEIYSDVSRDILNLDDIKTFLQRQLSSTKSILTYYENPQTSIEDSIQFMLDWRNTLQLFITERRENTWDEIKSSGSARILIDKQLMDTLDLYYQNYDEKVSIFKSGSGEARAKWRVNSASMLDLNNLVETFEASSLEVPIVEGTLINRIKSHVEGRDLLRTILTSCYVHTFSFNELQLQSKRVLSYMEEHYGDILNLE